MLSSIFKFGSLYGFTNPVSQVRGFKDLEIKKEMQFWTKGEFETLIATVNDVKYKTLFSFLYIMGTRKGETLALQWKDINFEKKEVKINKTVTKETDAWVTTSSKY